MIGMSPIRRRQYLEHVRVDSIRIKNFKAFKDTGWIPIRKVTYLMGGNSAGKTSIINAIKFISSVINKRTSPINKDQSFLCEFPLSNSDMEMDLGTIDETIFDGAKDFTIQIRTLNKYGKGLLEYSFTFGKPKSRKAKQITNAALLALKINTEKGILIEWTPEENNVELSLKTLKDFGYNNKKITERLKEFQKMRLDMYKKSKRLSEKWKKTVINDVKNADSNFLLKLIEKLKRGTINIDESGRLKKFSSYIEVKEEMDSSEAIADFGEITDSMSQMDGWLGDIFRRLIASFVGLSSEEELIENPPQLSDYKGVKGSMPKAMGNDFNSTLSWHIVMGRWDYDGKLIETLPAEFLKIVEKFTKGKELNGDETSKYFETMKELQEDIYDNFVDNFGAQNFLDKSIFPSISAINAFTGQIDCIPPLRAVANRTVNANQSDASTTVYRQILSDEKSEKKLKYIAKHFLKKLGGGVTNLKVERSDISDDLLVPAMKENGKLRNLSDFGFGFSQVIPVLWSCLEENQIYGLTTVEEPEIHLHPRAQAILAEYYFNLRENGFLKPSFIETHSEHMILKTQVLIKNEPKNHKDFQIVYVSREKKKTKTISNVQTIDFDEDGQLSEPFPDEFFDLSYQLARELF